MFSFFVHEHIASTEEELRKTRKERDDIRREKDEIIAELQFKIDHMESAYESVLHVCINVENLGLDLILYLFYEPYHFKMA